MSQAVAGPAQGSSRDGGHVLDALLPWRHALLFGLRVWGAVVLTLYVVYWLELDNAYWAGTTAAIVCQPSLGASLRKASFRMVGTVVGGVAIVVLTACLPQSRGPFLLCLALWGAACGFMATVLRNFASYAAGLAGYTAVIIASDELGAVGGPSGEAFNLAVTRASEICIGIVCAGLVLAMTDFGQARRRLIGQFADIVADIADGLVGTFLPAEAGDTKQMVRRDLIRRVTALSPAIDEAIGETADLRYRSRALQAAVEGLFAALSGWRRVAHHLGHLPDEQRRRLGEAVLRRLPEDLRPTPELGEALYWTEEAGRLRRSCVEAVRGLVAWQADTPSSRLVADGTAQALMGVSRAADALVLLTGTGPARARDRMVRLNVPDWLPACVSAARVFFVTGAAELFWIVTAWPNGASAVTWAAIFVILYSSASDQAYAGARGRLIAIFPTAALAAIVKFAVLPGIETFAGFAVVMGLVLVPAGALSTLSGQAPVFVTITSWFIPFVAPENQFTYDTVQFYNATLAIVAGAGAATLAFRLIPPLSPAFRTSRLLGLTLRDLRRLATTRGLLARDKWEGRVYGRLSVLPEQATPLQRAQLLAALAAGTEVIRLRRLGRRVGLGVGFDAALDALAQRQVGLATDRLERIGNALGAGQGGTGSLRAQGSIRVLVELLVQHKDYFGSKGLG
ncbi:MAG TPA: FUSC family protein [Rhodopila sp.]|nr:FUSC family protein [Rhodopila sp.]